MRWLDGCIPVLTLCAGIGCGGRAGQASAVEITEPGSGLQPGRRQARPETAPTPARPPSGGSSTGGRAPIPPEPVPVGDAIEPARPYAQTVLETYCGACHGAAAIRSGNVQGFADIEDIDALVARGWIVPLRSDQSLIVQVMLDGSMPPPGVEPRPTVTDIASVIDFIDNPIFWPVADPTPGVDAGAPATVFDAGTDAG
jgi:mono/diheme cytochrome c family protein